MKLKKHYIFFYSFIVFSGILTSNIALSIEELDIKFIPSCGKTRGGISVAEPPNKIYFCAQRINKIEWYFPNITEFFFIHEIMHLKHNTGDEKFVDCLAAKEFFQYKNGNKIIAQVIKFIKSRPLVDDAHGGSGPNRANIISGCYK